MITPTSYLKMWSHAARDTEGFWAERARTLLHWDSPFTTVRDVSFQKPVHIRWYTEGTLNAAYNCLDRHLPTHAATPALCWYGDEPGQERTLTYGDLHAETGRMASVLQGLGITKGDRVALYLPMIPEAVVAMLACARLGAIHSVVFAGFSPDALASRINDSRAKVVITANEGRRGGKGVALKANVDAALTQCPSVTHVLTIQHTDTPAPWQAGRDVWWHEARQTANPTLPAVAVEAEHPLFLLYTSGSTGTPKAIQHSTGGYLVYAAHTYQTVFDYRPGDIHFSTADVGWITGHTYTVYGPLASGSTVVLFEGVPSYPTWSRYWQIVDASKATTFYTAPTAIRALMREGEGPLAGTSRASLRLLGSVGEPINPEAWHWYHQHIGGGTLPIVDTWWQTETGGILITPLPNDVTDMPPGSACQALPGIRPALMNGEGLPIDGPGEGALCLATSWPGQMRTIWGDHARFEDTYFSAYPGYYFSGDGARRDGDGHYWITGRMDDVLNVSGHRLGTAEIEAAINTTPGVVESAVVGMPHALKGQGITAFVVLKEGVAGDAALRGAIFQQVRGHLSPIATPDAVHFAGGLPKTRSGKILRRILRKIASGETENLGDTSTLADPGVVAALVAVVTNSYRLPLSRSG